MNELEVYARKHRTGAMCGHIFMDDNGNVGIDSTARALMTGILEKHCGLFVDHLDGRIVVAFVEQMVDYFGDDGGCVGQAALPERCERLEQENARLKAAARETCLVVGGVSNRIDLHNIGFLFVEEGGVANIHGCREIGTVNVGEGGTVIWQSAPKVQFGLDCRTSTEPEKVLEDLGMRQKYREMTGVDLKIDPQKIRKAFGSPDPVDFPEHISSTRCTDKIESAEEGAARLTRELAEEELEMRRRFPGKSFGLNDVGELVVLEDDGDGDMPVPQQKCCTCPINDLMVRGCTCGAPK